MILRICKYIFFTISFLLYFTSNSLSEITSNAWSTDCSNEKNVCIIAINNEIKTKDNKIQKFATAYVQIGSSKQKKMNLINEDDQTYKLSEENKNITILFVNLPLNTDLKKKPMVLIDYRNLGNLTFTHCNNADGCKANVIIGDEVINLFKKGKTMTVLMGIYGSTKVVRVEFPLKNFTKSYAQLIKE